MNFVFGRARYGPDFICIGSSRCGTTSLYRHLRNHPQIWMPPVKELHYFGSRSGQRGKPRWNTWARKHFFQMLNNCLHDRGDTFAEMLADTEFCIRYLTGRRSDEWYLRLFSAPAGYLSGEITPSYCVLSDEEVKQVAGLFPEILIIFLMRDPISRCWSSVIKAFVRRQGRKIDQVQEREIYDHLDGWGVQALTRYDEIIDKWESAISRDRMFYGFLDEFEETPTQFLQRLYRFLDISDNGETIGVLRKANDTSQYKSDIPKQIEVYLARRYLPMVRKLEARFEVYPTRWRKRMEAVLSGINPGVPGRNDQ